jgi:hypothetical protein
MKTNNDLDKSVSSDMPEDLTNNLKILESKSNIKLFKKYNNILILRDINKIKYECNRMKKKHIIELSNDLKNFCYNNINIELYKIKELQEKANNNIHEIDNLMNVISNNDYFINLQNDIYIEVYEN